MFRALLLASCVALLAAIDDFTATDHSYQFIFHDTADLLLTVHGDSCYFAYVENDYQDENRYLNQYRRSTEHYIERLIYRGDSKVQPSDLESMRTKFHDLLADFHCLEKHIYSIQLDFDDVQDIIDSFHHGYHHGGD